MEGQAEQVARLRQSIAATRTRAEELRGLLTPGMLLTAPGDGGWTIGQIFEHMIVTHEAYIGRVRSLVARAVAAAQVPAERPWKPSLIGGWLSRIMEKPGKIPAPGRFRPGVQPRSHVIADYLKCQAEMAAQLDASAALDWNRLRLSSPASPLIRMNLGDAFTIVFLHDARHLLQIERVRDQPRVPEAPLTVTPPVGLLALAFLAGLVDSAVGGGGLIQIPALLLFMPGVPVPDLLGTNKLASLAGTSTAATQYARRVRVPWKALLPAALTAFVFSFLGARTVSRLDSTVLRPVMLGLLVVMAIYMFTRRDFGDTHAPRFTPRQQLIMSLLTAALLGFYDGFFGPGTGSLLLFVFITIFGFDFLVGAACAKIVNVATNLSAAAYFVSTGQVLYWVALPMAVCNMTGSALGSRLAMGRGRPYVRILFLIVLAALIFKLAYDMRSH